MQGGLHNYIRNSRADLPLSPTEFDEWVKEAFQKPKDGAICQARADDGLWYDYKMVDGEWELVGLSERLMCG